MTDSSAPRGLRSSAAAASAKARSALRRLLSPLARPVFTRLYSRVDLRTAAAIRAAQSSQAGGLDELAEQLELARAAAVSSAAGARELRREHDQLKERLRDLEDRLAELTARVDGQPAPRPPRAAAPRLGHEQPTPG